MDGVAVVAVPCITTFCQKELGTWGLGLLLHVLKGFSKSARGQQSSFSYVSHGHYYGQEGVFLTTELLSLSVQLDCLVS